MLSLAERNIHSPLFITPTLTDNLGVCELMRAEEGNTAFTVVGVICYEGICFTSCSKTNESPPPPYTVAYSNARVRLLSRFSFWKTSFFWPTRRSFHEKLNNRISSFSQLKHIAVFKSQPVTQCLIITIVCVLLVIEAEIFSTLLLTGQQ